MVYPVGRAVVRCQPVEPDVVRFEPVEPIELLDTPARFEVVEVIHADSGALVGWWVVDTVPESPAGTAYGVHGFYGVQADAACAAAELDESG